jgi:hypothetical protein
MLLTKYSHKIDMSSIVFYHFRSNHEHFCVITTQVSQVLFLEQVGSYNKLDDDKT